MARAQRNHHAGSSLRLLVVQVALLLLLCSSSVVQSQTCSAPPPNTAAAAHTNAESSCSDNTHTVTTTSSSMATEVDYKAATSIYDFTVKDSHGEDVSLEKYRGKVVLFVNIASNCGLTKNNYAKLTLLKNKYAESGFSLLSFPCNQFAGQMPEADGEEMVCHLKSAQADVGDVFAKVNVNGDAASPVWKYLKHKLTGTLGSGIKWNFTKFLVDKNGQPVERFGPTTDPMDIAAKIEKLLAAE